MNANVEPAALVLGGVSSPGALDRVRRYCGLGWSGGPPETWAFRYFDVVETPPDHLDPVDVMCAAALHPGVGRKDLEFFVDQRSKIESWLTNIPVELALADTDNIDALRELVNLAAPSFTLLTKVLHHKRPHLVPIVDRHVLDRYRPITGERQALRAWPTLIEALRNDVRTNESEIARISNIIETDLHHRMSALRVCDIVVWMDAR